MSTAPGPLNTPENAADVIKKVAKIVRRVEPDCDMIEV